MTMLFIGQFNGNFGKCVFLRDKCVDQQRVEMLAAAIANDGDCLVVAKGELVGTP